METVVIVAIGVLATIFLASFVALVVVCRQRYCRPKDLLHPYDTKPIVDLIGAMETQSEPSELELDDVVITNPHIEAILENEDWIEDASGLVSHCIAILKCPCSWCPQRSHDCCSHCSPGWCPHGPNLPVVGVPKVSTVPKSPRLVSTIFP
ncbi:transmembrane protein 98 isoform X1 [Meleagris gallopavo]|uniref:transmembrane protein 98 isoform X1 n=1 Tax=Meleagris gallopavo TaxID=9103 RepID=UPI00093FC06C|nr:transmembrane protein 98 isoform X1 [Meleagris gallopavo]XP_019467238.1 transmembrane protein 98 isoform X1 [Meleagris gallopavo]XP_031413597.1 transmembrane protein 98 isoform X1 [Meleagris gallopavo]